MAYSYIYEESTRTEEEQQHLRKVDRTIREIEPDEETGLPSGLAAFGIMPADEME